MIPSFEELTQKIAHLEAESARFAARYQDIVANYYRAQADYLKSELRGVQLRQVVQAKQEVIRVLLLFYPKPLTPSQQQAIDLTGDLTAEGS